MNARIFKKLYYLLRLCFLILPFPQKPWFWFSWFKLKINIPATILQNSKYKIITNNLRLLHHLLRPMSQTSAEVSKFKHLLIPNYL